jgi:hypothetical protein
MVICFISFCVVLVVAILKFRSVTVEHSVKVNVSARSVLAMIRKLIRKGKL